MATVAGLDIDLSEGTPLSAVVILKYLDEDGDYRYQVSRTDGVSMVEALGMVGFAQISMNSYFASDAEI